MFCTNCGTKNDNNALFCSGCGTRFDVTHPTVQTELSHETGFHSNKRTVGIVIAAVAAIAALIIGFFVLTGGIGTQERTYKDVVADLCKAVENCDAKAIVELLPDDVITFLMEENNMTKRELINDLQDVADEFSAYSITYEILGTEPYDDLENLKAQYNQAGVNVSDAKIVNTIITLIIEDETDSDRIGILLIKVDGQWYLSVEAIDSIY